MNVFELLKVVFDLAKAAMSVPDDWNNEVQVDAWLGGLTVPLSKVIVFLVPDGTTVAERADLRLKATSGLVGNFVGKKPGDLDWGTVVDWVVSLLSSLFPQYETLIVLVGTVLKQIIGLLQDEVVKLGEGYQL